MTDAIRFSRQQLPASMDLALNAVERAVLWMHSASEKAGLDERVRRAVDLLTEKLREPFALERLAKECGLSVSRLAHLFRDQMGVNLVRWREDQRIILAKHLLHATRFPVARVASLVGYDDQMYFSRVFRKRVGSCPTDFRRTSEALPAPCVVPDEFWGDEAGIAAMQENDRFQESV